MRHYRTKYQMWDWVEDNYYDGPTPPTLTPKQERMLEEVLEIGNKELLNSYTELVTVSCDTCHEQFRVRVNKRESRGSVYVCPKHSMFGMASGFFDHAGSSAVLDLWNKCLDKELSTMMVTLGLEKESS